MALVRSYSGSTNGSMVVDGVFRVYSGGSLSGVVRDSNGNPVYNAVVELIKSGTVVLRDYTLLNGSFTIGLSSIPPGKYLLRIHKFGYRDIYLNVSIEPSTANIAIVGDYNGDLKAIFEPLGYNVTVVDSIEDILDNVSLYKAVILNDMGSDIGYTPLIQLMDKASEYNVSLVFLDSWDSSIPTYYHSLYLLYEYNSYIEDAGYPAPDQREDEYPDGQYVTIHVLEPDHPIFRDITYDADPSNYEFYLGSSMDNYMDYAYDVFNDDENITVLANIKDTYNNIEEQCVVEYRSKHGAPWYYFSAGASYEWDMYNNMGMDNMYSWSTRQMLINMILYTTGYLGKYRLYGVVYNESSGEPVYNATVKIIELGLETTTDEEGRFEFTGLSPGIYSLYVSAEGFYSCGQKVAVKIGADTFVEIDLIPKGATKWLVLVYLDGDNNLEDCAIEDFNEMELIGSKNGVDIVVLFDRIDGYDYSNGDWTGTRLYHVLYDPDESTINSEQLPLWDGSMEEEFNMGDPGVLQNFIEYAYSLYGGDHIALILWDHGSGFYGTGLKGSMGLDNVAYDDTDGDSLDESEIRQVLENLADKGIHIDLLAMDACLMGMIEIAYEFNGLVDVYVASEETVPGDGYEYNYWLDDLVSNSGMSARELGEAMVNAYMERYGSYSDVCLSALDVSVVATSVVDAVNNFSQYAIDHMSSLSSVLENARDAASNFYYSDFKDLIDLMEKVKYYSSDPLFDGYADDVINAVSSAVIASWTSSDLVANGASIWFPTSSGWSSDKYAYMLLKFTSDTLWDDVLDTLYSGGTLDAKVGFRKGIHKPVTYMEWSNVVHYRVGGDGNESITITLEPIVENSWIDIMVSGYTGYLYIDFYGANDTTSVSCISIGGDGVVRVYAPEGVYTLKVWVIGGKPALYNVSIGVGRVYSVSYTKTPLRVALIGSSQYLQQFLQAYGIDCDLYQDYTLLVDPSEYNVIVVDKWGSSTPSASDVVSFIEDTLGNGSSLVLLDTYDESVVTGGHVVYSYRDTIVSHGIPVPEYRGMEKTTNIVYYVTKIVHPVNDPYRRGAKLQLVYGIGQHSLVYYSGYNGGYALGEVYSGGNKVGYGVIMYKLGSSIVAYVSFGSTGLNPGEDYNANSYSYFLKRLVLNTVVYSATDNTVETPAPVPEQPRPLGIQIAIIASISTAISIIWLKKRVF